MVIDNESNRQIDRVDSIDRNECGLGRHRLDVFGTKASKYFPVKKIGRMNLF